MSISLFHLPHYKDMTHVSLECYLEGKAPSCKGTELEDFAPIWSKMTAGKFPGSLLKLKRRIRDDEYSKYPIVFISSTYWAANENNPKGHGYTSVHVVQKQNQNVSNCKSYENRFIDRETGVIILETTKIKEGAIEPDFKYWFYEKDTRKQLSNEVLKEFSKNCISGSHYLSIKKFKDMPIEESINLNEYEHEYEHYSGYLKGDFTENLIKENTFSDRLNISFELIEWQDSWNFVIKDYYGQKMFKIKTEDVQDFLIENDLAA